jgi:dUTPase
MFELHRLFMKKNMDALNVRKLHPQATLPIRGSTGYTLYALNRQVVLPYSQILIHTGLNIHIPKTKGVVGFVYDCVCHIVKNTICLDSKLGELRVLILNNGPDPHTFESDRICQMILVGTLVPPIREITNPEKLGTRQIHSGGSFC